MKFQRLISSVLVISLLSGLVSCAGESSGEVTTTAPDTTTTAPVVTEIDDSVDAEGYLRDDLSPDLDFGGETVTILGWNHYEDVEFYAEKEVGEVVNDAFFNRNRFVEERLKVTFEFLEVDARYGSEFSDAVNKSVMSNIGEYDIGAAHSHDFATGTMNGSFVNLFNVEHIDLEKPWWVQSLATATTIGDALYFAAGDISVSYLTRLQGVAFNSDLLDDYNLEDPYDLVLSGDWTYDKMIEMTKGIYLDLNSNGKKDEEDRFGLGSDSIQLQAVIFPAGIKIIEHGEDGKLALSPSFTSENMVNLIDKLNNIFHTTDDAQIVSVTDDISMFTEGRSLFFFWPLAILQSPEMRSAQFGYGFVPGPKYDKEQENYYCSSSNAFSLWGIPLDAPNKEMSGAVMEALASQGYRTTTPAVFEVAYKVKYNSETSEKQSQIFDIIRGSVQYDFGKIFYRPIGWQVLNYADRIVNNESAWISFVESSRKEIETSLKRIEKTFAKFNQQ